MYPISFVDTIFEISSYILKLKKKKKFMDKMEWIKWKSRWCYYYILNLHFLDVIPYDYYKLTLDNWGLKVN